MRSLIAGLLAIMLSMFSATVVAAGDAIPDSFKAFKRIYLGLEPGLLEQGPVYIDPGLKYVLLDQPMESVGRTIRFKLHGVQIDLGFSPGPSEDPTYLFKIAGKERPDSILGERLFLTSSGDIYVDSRNDRFFNAKRKYAITPQGVIEVKQPYYLVDLTCITNGITTLTSERCSQGDTVATLPEGTKVRVLVGESPDTSRKERMCPSNDSHQTSFLVATPFGLIGWVQTRIGSMYTPGKPLDCIRIWGD